MQGAMGAYCQQPPAERERKELLRQQSLQSDAAWAEYTQLISQHREDLQQCRRSRWPQIQAIWLRLYPCDANPGVLDQVFDQIVNLGYNRVFIETFFDGRTLLPGTQADPWPSIHPQSDLLDLALTAAKRRGLSAYAWMFSLNFGYSYGERPDRQSVLARDGNGRSSILDPNTSENLDDLTVLDQVFVDPFHPQARQDYLGMLDQVLQRQPDGVLFDYIRYPRKQGAESIADQVKDLWIYGDAARTAFLQLGTHPASQALLQAYLDRGYLTVKDVTAVNQDLPATGPLWSSPGQPIPTPESPVTVVPAETLLENSLPVEGETPGEIQGEIQAELIREPQSPLPNPSPSAPASPQQDPSPTAKPTPNPAARLALLQPQLWPLAIDFARYGILDFLTTISQPVLDRQIPAGVVFFPDGNAAVGEGYDSRLQPWDQFSPKLELHPMSYAKCEDASCVGEQVSKVVAAAPPGTFICPALAGLWGQTQRQRPALEIQMQQLQQRFPQLPCVSHFAYSWIEPISAKQRQSCTINS
jgi:hypothetical protein